MQKYMLLAIVFFWILSHAEASCPKYNRKDYRHWIDSDRDCQNTRNEVLIQESLKPTILDFPLWYTVRPCRALAIFRHERKTFAQACAQQSRFSFPVHAAL